MYIYRYTWYVINRSREEKEREGGCQYTEIWMKLPVAREMQASK